MSESETHFDFAVLFHPILICTLPAGSFAAYIASAISNAIVAESTIASCFAIHPSSLLLLGIGRLFGYYGSLCTSNITYVAFYLADFANILTTASLTWRN